jgi:tetratricopeptide (TPR) repeat protein
MTGHWTEGNAWLERALAADPRPSPARLEALENLGENAGYQGDVVRAEAVLREGLDLARRLGVGAKVSSMLHALGAQLVDQGRYEEGEILLDESVAEARRAGDRYDEALSGVHLGAAAWGRGDYATAIARLEAARTLAREFSHPMPAANASRYLGLIAAEAGGYARAAEWHREWLAYDRDSAQPVARSALDVASLAAARGEAERAARLFGAATALAEAIGFAPSWPERGLHEREIARARTALGGDAFDTIFDAGRRLSRERVIDEVEAVLDAAAPRVAADSSERQISLEDLTPNDSLTTGPTW